MMEGASFCRQCGHRAEKAEIREDSPGIGREIPFVEPTQTEKQNKKPFSVILIAVGALVVLVLGFGIGILAGGGSSATENGVASSNGVTAVENSNDADTFEEGAYLPESDTKNTEDDAFIVEEQTVQAAGNSYGAGIHQYSYHVVDCSWYEAMNDAASRGGYLVHINSQAEMDYIVQEINELGYDKKQFMIGARRDNDSSLYYWVNEYNELIGDSINSSSFWADGEPSYEDNGNTETCVDIFYYSKEGRWIFNDIPSNMAFDSAFEGRIGYIVEYEY